MINPDYDISVYNNIFNDLLLIILILLQITRFSTSGWEDKVTATKIRGYSMLTKTLLRGCSRVYKNGLIKIMTIVCLCVLPGKIMT